MNETLKLQKEKRLVELQKRLAGLTKKKAEELVKIEQLQATQIKYTEAMGVVETEIAEIQAEQE
jgi:ATP-dependent protease HslVU (ClpYQ) ATPase subunit